MRLTSVLPTATAVPPTSSAEAPVAAKAAVPRSIATGSPRSCWAPAWRSIICPKTDGYNAANAPRPPPTSCPGGPSGVPAIAPSFAPPAAAAMLAPCPAKIRGTSPASALLAATKPCSSKIRFNRSSDGPSPASSPIRSPRRKPASAASSGEPVTAPTPATEEETSCSIPRLNSPPMVDCLGWGVGRSSPCCLMTATSCSIEAPSGPSIV